MPKFRDSCSCFWRLYIIRYLLVVQIRCFLEVLKATFCQRLEKNHNLREILFNLLRNGTGSPSPRQSQFVWSLVKYIPNINHYFNFHTCLSFLRPISHTLWFICIFSLRCPIRLLLLLGHPSRAGTLSFN